MNFVRTSVAALALTLAASAVAQVDYRVTPATDLKSVRVDMSFRAKGAETRLQLPSWSPGLYVKEDYWKTLNQVTATDERGRALSVAHLWGDTWVVTNGTAKQIHVHYDRPINHGMDRLGMFSGDAETVHYSGPRVYLYLADRKTEPCHLAFATSDPVAIGLPTDKNKTGYVARGYDELADNPVTLGKFVQKAYTVRGVEFTLALRGPARDKIDTARAVKIASFLSDVEMRFFGGAPFRHYVWHVTATAMKDGAGGVEHATSTQIFLATGMGPGAVSGMAHEFFHLWNVKRIRSEPLGPFDYTQLPAAGDLWWLEGVTDYYAATLPFRGGYGTHQDFLDRMADEISRVRSNTARFEVSPWDSGQRTPEASNPMSSGYGVSYYPTGWVLGLMLDIELRARTGGKHTLDDVEHALWQICRGGMAFRPGEIRRQLIRFGGPEMGDLYDRWVMKPGELPTENVLAKAGLHLQRVGNVWKVREARFASAEAQTLRNRLLQQEPIWKD